VGAKARRILFLSAKRIVLAQELLDALDAPTYSEATSMQVVDWDLPLVEPSPTKTQPDENASVEQGGFKPERASEPQENTGATDGHAQQIWVTSISGV
jgi:hypothetical protein